MNEKYKCWEIDTEISGIYEKISIHTVFLDASIKIYIYIYVKEFENVFDLLGNFNLFPVYNMAGLIINLVTNLTDLAYKMIQFYKWFRN